MSARTPTSRPSPPLPSTSPDHHVSPPVDAGEFAVSFPTVSRLTPIPDLGRYELVEEIARGGMGAIYRTRDRELNREVALKVLLEQHVANPYLVRRFLREVRITAHLQHPGIVPVYEIGELTDGRPFFTMKMVHGQTLSALLAERASRAQTCPRLVTAFEQTCQAMAYAHAQGVIHRDLKPSNVMVGAFGEVQVMDWGLGKQLGDQTPYEDRPPPPNPRATITQRLDDTVAGSAMGTPAYMAPEQATGQIDRLTPRSDVFGLGAILCEILTGKPPYEATDNTALMRMARRADLQAALARLDGCAADPILVVLAARCLATNPDDRPASAGVVAQEMTEYVESDLRRAERDLVRFFDLSLDLFCIAGLDGYFRRVNSNFTRVLGYTIAELTTSPFLEFVHRDDHARTQVAMRELIAGHPVVQFRNRYRDTHGRYRWFEWTAKSIPDEKIIFAVARDVTDRVELEEQLHRNDS